MRFDKFRSFRVILQSWTCFLRANVRGQFKQEICETADINSEVPRHVEKEENIYETDCPILYAMELIGQKWKLPILWYIADAENQTLRYRELERKVVGITATMLTKCLRELERDKFVTWTQYPTIPPTVEYSLAERGKTLIPALESVYKWADEQMQKG